MAKKKHLPEGLSEMIEEVLEKFPNEDLESKYTDICNAIETALKINIEGSISRYVDANFYFKETEGLSYPCFRLYFSIEELGIFVKLKPRGQSMGAIFKKLKERFMSNGCDNNDSMKKANNILTEFYSACAELSATKENSPFMASIFKYSKKTKGLENSTNSPTSN